MTGIQNLFNIKFLKDIAFRSICNVVLADPLASDWDDVGITELADAAKKRVGLKLDWRQIFS